MNKAVGPDLAQFGHALLSSTICTVAFLLKMYFGACSLPGLIAVGD